MWKKKTFQCCGVLWNDDAQAKWWTKTEKDDESFNAFHLEIFRNDLYQQKNNRIKQSSTLSNNVQRGIEHDQLSTVITVKHDCITIEHDCVTIEHKCVTIEHGVITMRHDLALITEEWGASVTVCQFWPARLDHFVFGKCSQKRHLYVAMQTKSMLFLIAQFGLIQWRLEFFNKKSFLRQDHAVAPVTRLYFQKGCECERPFTACR